MRLRPLLPLLHPVPALKRALVLGLARSGRAAQAALEAGGTEVVAADRTLGNDEDLSLLDGVEVLVKSPGVPGEAPLVAAARERGIPVWSEIELAARLLPNPILGVTGTNGKTTTTELLGAMLGARTAGQRRHGAERARRRRAGGRMDRLRALELPARGRRPLPAADRRAAQPRARPPRPARQLRGVPGREAADLREPGRPTTSPSCPAASAPVPGAARRVEFAADDELPAEPLIPGAHNRENAAAATAAARAAGLDDAAIAAGAAHVPRRRAPARARGRDRRRPLRQRLEGDEHRRRPPRADRVRRAAPPDPRRPREGRELGRARAGRRGGERRHRHT